MSYKPWRIFEEQCPAALSPFKSLKIKRSANFSYFRNVVRQIFKLQSCERVSRAVKVVSRVSIFYFLD